MSRSVSAVSMARSEYCRGPPRLPTPTASQVAIASGANHTVISPRWTSARSYAGQFPTWYFVLYFGCTLDFMSRSFTCRRYDGQEVDRGAPRARDPCTNAPAGRDTLPPADVTPIRLPARAPNLNAYTERFVRTIKDSCLERMVLLGKASLRRAVREFVAHYYHERNHQGLDNRRILPLSTAPPPRGRVPGRQRLGGMLNYYYRSAA